MGLLPHSLPVPVTCCRIVSPFAASSRLLPSICAASRQIRMPTSISEPPGATPGCASAWRGRRAAHAALWAPPPTGRTLTPSRSPASIPCHPLAHRVPPGAQSSSDPVRPIYPKNNTTRSTSLSESGINIELLLCADAVRLAHAKSVAVPNATAKYSTLRYDDSVPSGFSPLPVGFPLWFAPQQCIF